MSKTSKASIGSSFESWLDEEQIRDEVTSTAIKTVLAYQLQKAMAERGLTKSALATEMKTKSRTD